MIACRFEGDVDKPRAKFVRQMFRRAACEVRMRHPFGDEFIVAFPLDRASASSIDAFPISGSAADERIQKLTARHRIPGHKFGDFAPAG